MIDLHLARSWLFVPGDSERKLAKCWSAEADVIIVDLEDAVTPENKLVARGIAANAIGEARAGGVTTAILIRLNSLQTGLTEADIAATIGAGADGFVAPKVANAADVVTFSQMLTAAEKPGARPAILAPIATEAPAAIFRLPEIAAADERVKALLWGMEDLGAEVGSRRTRRPDGEILDAFKTVRALALFAGAAAGIACVDTPFVDFSDTSGLEREATEASWIGFSGKLAIHPSQVPVINAAFSPSDDEIEEARTILAMSREGGGGAAFRYRGRMVDTPHLVAAERLLARLQPA